MKVYRIISILLAMVIIICVSVACGTDAAEVGGTGNGGGNSPGASSGSGNAAGSETGGGSSGNSGNSGNSSNSGNSGDSGNSGNSSSGGGAGTTDNGEAGNGSGSGGEEIKGGGETSGNGEDAQEAGAGGNAEPGGSSGAAGLSGTPEEILGKLIDDLRADGVEMPMSIPPMKVEADMSQNTVGLSEDDFEKLVADSAYTMAAIGTFAHQMIIIQATDAKAATDIKQIVSGDNGYDPKKWICVFPEKAVAVESGVYVLIVASYAAVADAAVEIFKEAAGGTGEVNEFWEFSGEAGGDAGMAGGMGGGLILG